MGTDENGKVEVSFMVKGKIRVDVDDIERLSKLDPVEGVGCLFEQGYDIKTQVMGAPSVEPLLESETTAGTFEVEKAPPGPKKPAGKAK